MQTEFVDAPRHELQATTLGPDPEPRTLAVLPGTVAALFLSEACWSEAGLMGGNEGADMGAGVDGDDLSGKDRVAMWGRSVSGKKDLVLAGPSEEDGGLGSQTSLSWRGTPRSSLSLLIGGRER